MLRSNEEKIKLRHYQAAGFDTLLLRSERAPRYFGQREAPPHCYPGTLYFGGVDAPLLGGYVRMEGRTVCWRFPRGKTALALATPEHCKDLRQFRVCTVY
jgi:hypothetical protein